MTIETILALLFGVSYAAFTYYWIMFIKSNRDNIKYLKQIQSQNYDIELLLRINKTLNIVLLGNAIDEAIEQENYEEANELTKIQEQLILNYEEAIQE